MPREARSPTTSNNRLIPYIWEKHTTVHYHTTYPSKTLPSPPLLTEKETLPLIITHNFLTAFHNPSSYLSLTSLEQTNPPTPHFNFPIFSTYNLLPKCLPFHCKPSHALAKKSLVEQRKTSNSQAPFSLIWAKQEPTSLNGAFFLSSLHPLEIPLNPFQPQTQFPQHPE